MTAAKGSPDSAGEPGRCTPTRQPISVKTGDNLRRNSRNAEPSGTRLRPRRLRRRPSPSRRSARWCAACRVDEVARGDACAVTHQRHRRNRSAPAWRGLWPYRECAGSEQYLGCPPESPPDLNPSTALPWLRRQATALPRQKRCERNQGDANKRERRRLGHLIRSAQVRSAQVERQGPCRRPPSPPFSRRMA